MIDAMIREGTPQDIPGLARLRAAWTAEAGAEAPAGPEFRDAFEAWVAANPRRFFVAEKPADPVDPAGPVDPARLIGMLNLMEFERMPRPGRPASRWMYLANAYVLPEHRNAGVGGALVDAAVGYARGIGAVRVVTSPSPASKDFYARHGFEAAAELAVYRF